MCMIDDAENFDFHARSVRKARKSYRCCECRREIQAGETYEYVFGRYEGSTSAYRTCPHCIAAGTWLDEECNGHLFGGISEELSDHWSEDSSFHSVWLARALIGIRRQWRKRDGSLLPVMDAYTRTEKRATA